MIKLQTFTSIFTAPTLNGTNSMDKGEIYELELDGTILGKFELTNWRVQKPRLRPAR
jgi:hypothetical protein